MAESPGKWRQLGRLSGWQWRVLLASPFALLLTWLRLRSAGYQRTLRKAQPAGDCALPGEQQLELARQTAYAFAVAVKYGPWRPRCLLRSLALGWFLGRRGVRYELKIGVPAGEAPAAAPDFSAHAWVECAGEVLNDRENIAGEHNVFL